ncbi:ribbon-helix-helix domain-containing protein [Azospirillum sp.]|uniref:ribbon-helix-helix domain-containing protein n=1 Tax=Azospirillum sp. TaxID=34012 RepID=UPI002603F494|nr:ribbon-helix-helix domain-containing protein [Azospirillum sp.]
MTKRDPKKKSFGVGYAGDGPLKSRNIIVGGYRTSLQLELSMWDALEEIGSREGLSINKLCSSIKQRIEEQARHRGVPPDEAEAALTSAIPVFVANYYRCSSTEDGHRFAGHGGGDPFLGTPLQRPPDATITAAPPR